MPSQVSLHPAAIAEAQVAYEWYRRRSVAAATAFIDEIDEAVDAISHNPARYPSWILETRRYLFRRFPYFIIYRESPETVEVIAIAHARQKPGYWRSRI